MKQTFLFCCLTLFAATSFHQGPKKVKLPKAYVYIPSGTYHQQDGKTLSVQGFYLQSTEVTNLNYREFLSYLEWKDRKADLEKVQVHAEGWASDGDQLEGMEQYHQHPAYENYPVVNISREAVKIYCEWLQEILQERHPEVIIKVRLPSEMEWMYAARAGQELAPYPHGSYLRNTKGEFLYNFRQLGDEALHRNPETGEIEVREDAGRAKPSARIFDPAPAQSNAPNNFGLYNMSGNVAEMIAEEGRTKGGCFNSTGYDIRIDAPDEFAGVTGASPYIGFRPVVVVREREK